MRLILGLFPTPMNFSAPSAPTHTSDTVLVVDDDDQLRSHLGEMVSSWDFEPMLCAGGQEALDYLASHELPGLVLLDLMMPGMDGITVARRIQSQPEWSTLPLVFISGLDEPDELPPHVKYLRKPLLTGALLALVATYCRQKSRASQRLGELELMPYCTPLSLTPGFGLT
jgi:CheY-like chemotaxis protein